MRQRVITPPVCGWKPLCWQQFRHTNSRAAGATARAVGQQSASPQVGNQALGTTRRPAQPTAENDHIWPASTERAEQGRADRCAAGRGGQA
jgi:hypothetical protein